MNPVLLEPYGSLQVTVPDDNMGDIIGEINKRRGRVMGMNPNADGDTVVEAEVPMAEMSRDANVKLFLIDSRGAIQVKIRIHLL